MNANDEKILSLKNEIKSKKENLGEKKRFVPITNCILKNFIYGDIHIHTLKENDLKLLAIRLKSDIMAQKTLDICDVEVNGFKLEDWLEDVYSKLKIFQYQQKLENLNLLEKKLENLLSESKKTELAIGDLEKLISEN